MTGGSIIETALWSLGRNKGRTALTMIGIIVGVASVIGMVAMGEGAMASVAAEIASMGVNLLTVTPGSKTVGGFHIGAGATTTLTPADAEAIPRECPAVALVSPTVRQSAHVVFGNHNSNTAMQGVGQEFCRIKDWRMLRGSFFDEEQVRRAANVCVLGSTLATELFAGADPLGQMIRVKAVPMQVIGVLASKGQASTGQDQDDTLVIPWTTGMRKVMGVQHLGGVLVSAQSPAQVTLASAEIDRCLRARHRIKPDDDADYTVQTQLELAETRQQTTAFLVTLVSVVAAIALVVGGVGVMNIMLVSVIERTREIGIRMAIGAKPRDVLWQFLGEAVVLTTMGGLIGIGLGVGTALVVPVLVGWPTHLTLQPIVVSFLSSAAVGVFFGGYPALRASRLDPIDALRYE